MGFSLSLSPKMVGLREDGRRGEGIGLGFIEEKIRDWPVAE